MSQSIPLSELESSPAAKFEKLGDAYSGRIVAMDHRKQTDPKTGAVKLFPSGDPMMLWVVTVEMSNGETAALWAKGGKFTAVEGTGESMLNAIGTAVRAAGAQGVDVGAELAVAHTGLGKAEPGMNAPKLYSAQYRPAAAASVPVNLFTDPS